MSRELEVLMLEIQRKREKMIESARMNGFTSAHTIRFSQELDELIMEYQRFVQKKLYHSYVAKRHLALMWEMESSEVYS